MDIDLLKTSLAASCCDATSLGVPGTITLGSRVHPVVQGDNCTHEFESVARLCGALKGTEMECTVSWLASAGMAFVAETGSGHLLTMDGAPDGGGRNLAPRPMETLLAGTGGCTAYDVVLILQRGRHQVTDCQVKITAERAPQDPKVFTQLHMHFVLRGRGLPAAAVERAIALSHEKYCSATIMLGKTAQISTSFELLES